MSFETVTREEWAGLRSPGRKYPEIYEALDHLTKMSIGSVVKIPVPLGQEKVFRKRIYTYAYRY